MDSKQNGVNAWVVKPVSFPDFNPTLHARHLPFFFIQGKLGERARGLSNRVCPQTHSSLPLPK